MLFRGRKPKDTLSEDRDLVRRLLAGEEDAFDRLFADYFDGLFRFALKRLDFDEHLAKDIVQSTLCTAFEKLDSYRGEAAFFTWLCSLCRFEISAWFRRQQRVPPQAELAEEAPAVRAVLDLLAQGRNPENDLQQRELRNLVHLTLDHLPPRYGQALEWKYFDGLSVQEIASRLQLSPKAAESILTRAREAFRAGFQAVAREISGGYQGLRWVAPRSSEP